MGTRSIKTFSTDITIVGAGPAGTACALSLKESGLQVLLIDKELFPRDKICGDALSGKVMAELRPFLPHLKKKLSVQQEARDSWGIRFFSPANYQLDVPFKQTPSFVRDEGPSFVLPRYTFDHLLFSAIKEQTHIPIWEECRLSSLSATRDGWILETNKAQIHTRLLVDASGATSVMARKAYPFKSAPQHLSVGLRQYIKGVDDCHAQGYLELHYLKSVMPGYAWIFPMGEGKANVGIGLLSSDLAARKETLNDVYEKFLTHPDIKKRMKHATPLEKPKGFSLPFGSLRRKISGSHYLMTGDAAGLIDPFTGEGIANAIISGKLAAKQAILAFQENQFSEEFLSAYDDQLFAKIGQELSLSHKLQQLGRYPFLLNFMIKKAADNSNIQQLFTSMFDEVDIRNSLYKPSFYIRMLFS